MVIGAQNTPEVIYRLIRLPDHARYSCPGCRAVAGRWRVFRRRIIRRWRGRRRGDLTKVGEYNLGLGGATS